MTNVVLRERSMQNYQKPNEEQCTFNSIQMPMLFIPGLDHY